MTDENKAYNAQRHMRHYNDDVDVFDVFMVIWRRKFIILAFLIIGVLSTYLILSKVQPRYTAHSNILINSNTKDTLIAQIGAVVKPSLLDVGAILTELEILKSRKLVARVVTKLGLVNSNTTNENVGSSGEFRNLLVDGTTFKTLPPEAIDPVVSQTVTDFIQSLKVVSIPGSSAVKISFTSANPYKASLIANTLVDEYIDLKISEQYESQQKVTKWLDQRLKTLRDDLNEVESKVEIFKAENNYNYDVLETGSSKAIVNLQNKYENTREEYAILESQLAQLSKGDNKDVITALNSNVINTNFMQKLQTEKIRLETSLSELSNRYGPKHPAIIKTKSELMNTSQAIDKEFSNAKSVLKKQLSVVKARAKEMEKNIENGGPTDNVLKPEEITYLKGLEREAESLRLVLRDFAESYRNSIGKHELQESNVSIISYAAVPLQASFPNKKLLLSLSVLLSLFLGVIFAVIIEKISTLSKPEDEYKL